MMTRAVHEWAELEPDRHAWLAGCLRRHCVGDWGDVDAADWLANDNGVHHRRGRLLSAYRLPVELVSISTDGLVWIITDDLEEPDTATTILWPSDY
jgi:hypothetical protein